MAKRRVLILGAGGRDFFNFDRFFKNNPNYNVIAFTATQIPDITGRKYPKKLSGKLYPKGIRILDEKNLEEIIKKEKIDDVFFSYSDVSNDYLMERSSKSLSVGASFSIISPRETMIKSTKPVIAICASRTGSGKSPTSRKIVDLLIKQGKQVGVVRHPMPYGDLVEQEAMCFEKYIDLTTNKCTIEEREEYEPYLDMGVNVYAGVNYEKILKLAEKGNDVILWDGGNNDWPFYKPDLYITIVDATREKDVITHFQGNVNVRMADIIIISKEKTAGKKKVNESIKNIKQINPNAKVLHSNLKISIDNPKLIKNKKVIVIEDGPTLTHGGLSIGAGYLAAKKFGAKIVSPIKYSVGSIKKVFEKHKQLEFVLPAMGYGDKQIKELEETINKTPANIVLIGTPINLGEIISTKKKCIRVKYDLNDKGELEKVLNKFSNKFLK